MENVKISFKNMNPILEEARNTAKGAKLLKKARFKKPTTANPVIDALDCIYEMQYQFLGCGNIKLAAIVEATSILFEKRFLDYDGGFATVLYTDDEYFYEDADILCEMARKLYFLAEDNHYNEFSYMYSPILDAIRNKTAKFFRIQMPLEFTDGRIVYMSRIRLDTRMFPKRRIISNILPLLVLDQVTPDAMLLPNCFWDEKMLELQR